MKIRKLLALAGSDNVHEAALAAQRAQELMDRWDIEAGMLDTTSAPEPEETIQGETEMVPRAGRKVVWKGIMASHLAKANGCKAFWRTEPGGVRLVIVGRPSDVQETGYVFALLCKTVDTLARRDCKGLGVTWANSFRLGVVTAVGEKLREARRVVVEDMRREHAGNPLALVRLDQSLAKIDRKLTDVGDYLRGAGIRLNKGRPTVSRSAMAHQQGYSVGRREVDPSNQARAGLGAAKKQLG
jgi:hypothetical protein